MSLSFIIYLLILLVSCTIGIYGVRQLSNAYKFLLFLLIYTFISELLSRFSILTEYSHYQYWIYACIKIPMIIFILGIPLGNKGRQKSLFVLSFLVFLTSIISFVYLFENEPFPSILEMFTAPLTVLACLVAYKDILDSPTEEKLIFQPLFCFATAVIIYTSVTFTHISLYRYYIKHDIPPVHDGRIHTLFSWLYYAFLGYVLYIDSKKSLKDENVV